ncbi:GDP-mannose transporter [Trifolium medium]|uniref:GDP-mannose transporter n=1 Tax=Trifolium medium TaxID=97028 RepID=A0A392M007_9FABA|nr:GDP-mannose transporter [Trifolium medium]
MFIEEEGVKNQLELEERIVSMGEGNGSKEVCSGLVLGVKRVESEGDCWKWGEEVYSVKEAYHSLIDEEEEEQDWYKDVWNQLILSNMSMLSWRLFYKRLPTKENLTKRGILLNSSIFCVGGFVEVMTHENDNKRWYVCSCSASICILVASHKVIVRFPWSRCMVSKSEGLDVLGA